MTGLLLTGSLVCTDARQMRARGGGATGTAMLREMDVRFWLEQVDGEMGELV
jgi:hypothetical protein